MATLGAFVASPGEAATAVGAAPAQPSEALPAGDTLPSSTGATLRSAGPLSRHLPTCGPGGSVFLCHTSLPVVFFLGSFFEVDRKKRREDALVHYLGWALRVSWPSLR